MQTNIKYFFLTVLFTFISIYGQAQITSPNAAVGNSYMGNDYFIFCASSRGSAAGSLQAETPFGQNSLFQWEKYNFTSNVYENYGAVNANDTLVSRITNLADGMYRVSVTDIENSNTTSLGPVWVLNNWIEITQTEIPDSTSNCEEFKIEADYEYAPLNIIDQNTGNQQSVRNPNIDFTVQWKQGGELVRSYISPTIFPPIASDTPVRYDLTIEDEFGCIVEGSVDYDSKVTKADFVADPMDGEAVLEVNFNNTSVNYDSVYWFFYKDNYMISREIEEKGDEEPVDSVDFILHEDSPVHSYQMSGEYKVKLVTIKLNDTGNCYDTLQMAPGTFIKVDTVLMRIPNVFTPNKDGQNDNWVITSRSLKRLDVKIYNRWGGIVHHWKHDNITSSDFTSEFSVWDGTVNNSNRMATPGVYYYVIQYEARDIDRKNEKRLKTIERRESGVVHLFRGKQ